MEKIFNFINGEFTPSTHHLENFNPALGKVYGTLPRSTSEEAAFAVESAKKAFGSWSRSDIQTRSQLLRKLGELILDNLDALARAESIDSGKPISLAQQIEIPRSAQNFFYFADALISFHGESYRTNSQTINYTQYSPLGVVVAISPWNLPLYLLTWKIAPALAAGNTVVAKPSEMTPMTAYLLAQLVNQAGFPPGVLNVIHGLGTEVGAALVSHPHVKAVTFTGSTIAGRTIGAVCGTEFKKMALEMGGKNANVIFSDCDFDVALNTTLRSSFQNQGQICLCGSRIFIEDKIYNKFRDAFVQKTRELKQGNPLNPSTQQGAVVSEGHLNKILSYIEIAKRENGTILCGGKRSIIDGEFLSGYFVEPTIIEGLPSSSCLNQDEIFGPVVTLISFSNESELLEMVNSTKYGLATSVWTTNISRATRLANEIESGIVWINTWMNRDLRTPFGGVKESGYGREGGMEALKFMSEVKNVCIGG
jgi:aminomuconate-semialdehyde/2-hydroxymuconate-6-semialdehyde dehydrogenase